MALEHALQVAMFNAAYARCIDTDDLERWPDFFGEPCLYRVTTEEDYRAGYAMGIIYADSKAMLVDRVTALRNANIFEQHRYRHLMGMPSVLGVSGDEVLAETPLAVFRVMRDGSTNVFVTGRYIDRLRIAKEQTSIAERVVVCDSSTIDTLLAVPL